MYHLASERDVEELTEFFQRDISRCLYSYIDMVKYRISNPNLRIYCFREQEKIKATLVKYYGGVQIYGQKDGFPVKETARLIRRLGPSVICSPLELHRLLEPHFKEEYQATEGYVYRAEQPKEQPANKVPVAEASEQELEELAALICSDRQLGGHYTVQELSEQLLERKRERFGRSYIIRCGRKIVSHAATYAETEGLAVISGVITHPVARGKGLASVVITELCRQLLKEGKRPYLICYKQDVGRFYERLGFSPVCGWGKLSEQRAG